MEENKIIVKTYGRIVVSTRYGEMVVEVVDITPEYAKELLNLNTDNRTLRDKRVKMYADDMINGDWKLNGESIVIGNDGVVKNAQHRLEAIVKSGVTLEHQIVVRVPKEEANCYDTGLQRTTKDIVHYTGIDGAAFTQRVTKPQC